MALTPQYPVDIRTGFSGPINGSFDKSTGTDPLGTDWWLFTADTAGDLFHYSAKDSGLDLSEGHYWACAIVKPGTSGNNLDAMINIAAGPSPGGHMSGAGSILVQNGGNVGIRYEGTFDGDPVYTLYFEVETSFTGGDNIYWQTFDPDSPYSERYEQGGENFQIGTFWLEDHSGTEPSELDVDLDGSLDVTLGAVSLAASGTVDVAGTLAADIAAITSTTAGGPVRFGDADNTLADVTLSAAGTTHTSPVQPISVTQTDTEITLSAGLWVQTTLDVTEGSTLVVMGSAIGADYQALQILSVVDNRGNPWGTPVNTHSYGEYEPNAFGCVLENAAGGSTQVFVNLYDNNATNNWVSWAILEIANGGALDVSVTGQADGDLSFDTAATGVLEQADNILLLGSGGWYGIPSNPAGYTEVLNSPNGAPGSGAHVAYKIISDTSSVVGTSTFNYANYTSSSVLLVVQAGQAPTILGDASNALGDITLTATGAVTPLTLGVANTSIGEVSLSATGIGALVSALQSTIEDFTFTSSGAVAVTGELDVTLDVVSASSVAERITTGTMAITESDSTVSSGSATLLVSSLLYGSVGDISLSATGVTEMAGALDYALDGITTTTAGEVDQGEVGTLAITLGDISLSATGVVDVAGVLNATIVNFTTSTAGGPTITGTVAIVETGQDVLSLTGQAAFQFGRPFLDITAGVWLPSTPGADLNDMVDEAIPDLGDYIYTTSNSACEMQLTSMANPPQAGHKTLEYWCQCQGGQGVTFTFLEGTTVLDTWSHDPGPTTPTRYTRVLPTPTNPTDLRVRITSSGM